MLFLLFVMQIARTAGAANMPRASKSRKDWDRAYILYLLRLKGWTLRSLSFRNGYTSNALQYALRKPYPKAERIIAAVIGVLPRTIWPSRYVERRARGRKSSR